jgi:hypothetical protein
MRGWCDQSGSAARLPRNPVDPVVLLAALFCVAAVALSAQTDRINTISAPSRAVRGAWVAGASLPRVVTAALPRVARPVDARLDVDKIASAHAEEAAGV